MKKLSIIALAAVLGTTACIDKTKRTAYEGIYFRAKASKVDGQRDQFTVRVRGASRSLEGARQAALHEANGYCVGNFGGSGIEWVVGPDTPAEELNLANDVLVYRGRCPQAQDI